MKLWAIRKAPPWWILLLAVAALAAALPVSAEKPLASPATSSPGNARAIKSTGPATPPTTPPPPAGAGMVVSGILEGTIRVAIIRVGGDTFIAGVGEPVGDATVVAILPSKVVLKKGKTTIELRAPSVARAPLVLAATPEGATPPPPPGAGMIVTGIVEGKTRVAIIRAGGGTVVAGVGEPVGQATVVAILPTKVVLKENKKTFALPAPSIARAPLVLAATPEGATPPGTGMTVTGIVGGPTRVAIIQAGGETFVAGVGEPAGEATVVAILPRKVVLKKNGATFELRIP